MGKSKIGMASTDDYVRVRRKVHINVGIKIRK